VATVVAASRRQPAKEEIVRRVDPSLTDDPLWQDVEARARAIS
jgi:hypothetical protein